MEMERKVQKSRQTNVHIRGKAAKGCNQSQRTRPPKAQSLSPGESPGGNRRRSKTEAVLSPSQGGDVGGQGRRGEERREERTTNTYQKMVPNFMLLQSSVKSSKRTLSVSWKRLSSASQSVCRPGGVPMTAEPADTGSGPVPAVAEETWPGSPAPWA